MFSDYTLDVDRRELRRGSEPVPVEPQVFDLLILLIQNRDRVVSKDDLIASIWGGRIVSESALTSRVNAARKAVGDSGEHQRLIRTISRKGIRFVAEVSESADSPAKVVTADRPSLPSSSSTSPAENRSLPPLDNPSVAVMPFVNLSGDPKWEYFAEGIAEDIITELSRVSALFVIARNSSFTYRGRSPDLRQVGREFGVSYIVEGTVRRGGDRIRITANLIEAETGKNRWAEKYDRDRDCSICPD
jgi:TolB-like protein